MFCPNCGAKVEDDEKFCYNCGAPIKRRGAGAAPAAAPAVDNIPEPEPVRMPDPEPVYTPEPEPVYTPDPEPVFMPEPEPVRQFAQDNRPDAQFSRTAFAEQQPAGGAFDLEQFWKDNLFSLINSQTENKYAHPGAYIATFKPYISDKLMERTLKYICQGKASRDDVIGMLTLNLDENKNKFGLGRAGLVVTKYGFYYTGIPGTKEQVKQMAIGGLIYSGVKAAKKEVMAAQVSYADIDDASVEKEFLVVKFKNGKFLKINMGDYFNGGRFRDALKTICANI